MKSIFIICALWITTLIEGAPNDYKQWLQPRSISNLPFVDWFYGSSSETINEENEDPVSSLQHTNELSNLDELKSKEIDRVKDDNIQTEPKSEPKVSTDNAESAENAFDEQKEKNMDKSQLEKVGDTTKNNEIKVIPIDKVGPNDKPEPIENLLEDLKQEVEETKDDEERTNIGTLLTDLNTTMKEASTHLAKVFVNNAWRIFDIGALGTPRRTRNVDETGSILNLYYTLINMLSQLLGVLRLGGNSHLLGNVGGNNAQSGGLLQLLLPSLLTSYFGSPGVDQKILGGIAGLPSGKKSNSSKNIYIIIDDEHKKKANRLLQGKTSEVLLKIKRLLGKGDVLDTEDKFYIVLKLSDLYDRLSENDDETKLELIKLIIAIGEDPRFKNLFEIFKSKKDREYDIIWDLFKKKSKINNDYLTVIRNLPRDKIKEYPSRDCFIMTSTKKVVRSRRRKSTSDSDTDSDEDSDEDSDDEKIRSRKRRKVQKSDVESLLKELGARDIKSKNDYYICCIDDDDELKADRILSGKTNDDTIIKIEKYLKDDDLNPQYKWYIILKLYKMLKDLEKPEKDDKKDKDDRNKIIKLIILIGEDPKFDELLKGLKTKDDSRFVEIWRLLKNEPREPQEKTTPPSKGEQKERPKEDIKTEPELKKDDLVGQKDPAHVHNPPSVIYDERTHLPDISKTDFSTWRIEYDPILRSVEDQIKNPALDRTSKWDLINFIDQWYLSKVIDPAVKHKFDGIAKLIGGDPKFDETFDEIKRNKYNSSDVIKRVFNLFGKEINDPLVQHHPKPDAMPITVDPNLPKGTSSYDYSRTSHYYPGHPWLYKYTSQNEDDFPATLALGYKVDAVIDLFTMRNMQPSSNPYLEASRREILKKADDTVQSNRKDYDIIETLLLPQIRNPNLAEGDSIDFIIKILKRFNSYLYKIENDNGNKIYSKASEKRIVQNFIDSMKAEGVIRK